MRLRGIIPLSAAAILLAIFLTGCQFLSPSNSFAVKGSTGLDAIKIVTGDHHACLMTLDRQVYCWGSNLYGQLGLGHQMQHQDSYVARPVIDPLPTEAWHTVVAGGDRTCAMKTSGRVFCWGRNDTNQVGATLLGEANYQNAYLQPTEIFWYENTNAMAHRFSEIGLATELHLSVDALTGCVLKVKSTTYYCWGYAAYYNAPDWVSIVSEDLPSCTSHCVNFGAMMYLKPREFAFEKIIRRMEVRQSSLCLTHDAETDDIKPYWGFCMGAIATDGKTALGSVSETVRPVYSKHYELQIPWDSDPRYDKRCHHTTATEGYYACHLFSVVDVSGVTAPRTLARSKLYNAGTWVSTAVERATPRRYYKNADLSVWRQSTDYDSMSIACQILSSHEMSCTSNVHNPLTYSTSLDSTEFSTFDLGYLIDSWWAGDFSVTALYSVTRFPSALESISVGNGFACGLGVDRRVRCFGANGYGQSGQAFGSNVSSPLPIDRRMFR